MGLLVCGTSVKSGDDVAHEYGCEFGTEIKFSEQNKGENLPR